MGQIISWQNIPYYRNKHSQKVIVAACGCFDIFHIGHLDYLSGSKDLGDVLFVGVNSDSSILENKGKKPIFNIEQRMNIICALIYVNYVFTFDGKTFGDSLDVLKPNIFARGADKNDMECPEQDIIKKYNISMMTVGDCKKSSSRELRKNFE